MDDFRDTNFRREDEVKHPVVADPEAVQRRIVMAPERPDVCPRPGTDRIILEDLEPLSDSAVGIQRQSLKLTYGRLREEDPTLRLSNRSKGREQYSRFLPTAKNRSNGFRGSRFDQTLVWAGNSSNRNFPPTLRPIQ